MASDPTPEAVLADPGPGAPAGELDGQLQALRAKAGRIAEELAALYRRMDELQQQIQAHQHR